VHFGVTRECPQIYADSPRSPSTVRGYVLKLGGGPADTCDTIELPEVHDDAAGVRAYAAVRRRCLPSLTDATTTCYY
jgi:hypothetical protein